MVHHGGCDGWMEFLAFSLRCVFSLFAASCYRHWFVPSSLASYLAYRKTVIFVTGVESFGSNRVDTTWERVFQTYLVAHHIPSLYGHGIAGFAIAVHLVCAVLCDLQ
jgi:hypothetical protein